MDDDIANKVAFEQQVYGIWKRKTQNCVLLNRQEYNAKLQRLLEIENPQVSKSPQDFRLIKTYDYTVQEINGRKMHRLVKRGTSFMIVPIEEMYDILKEAHVHLKHGGRNSLQMYFRNKYANITKDCIMTFLNLCKFCPRKKKIRELRIKADPLNVLNNISLMDEEPEVDDDDAMEMEDGLEEKAAVASSSSSSFGSSATPHTWASTSMRKMQMPRAHAQSQMAGTENFSRGQIDIVEMSHRDVDFSHIFKYTNLQTGEIRLRAMNFGNAMEAANMLIDVYCEQGAPVVVQSGNGRELAKEVVSELGKMWPTCRQLHGEVRMGAAGEAMSNQALMEQLFGLQKRLNTNMWAQLLRFLQWEINSAYNNDLGRSIFENTYGKTPSLGLPSSKLLEAVYDKAQSEEQMLDYIADAELLRLSAFCTNACQQAQQLHMIPAPQPQMPRLHPRPVTASVNVSAGHFIDTSQLVPPTQKLSNASIVSTSQSQQNGGPSSVATVNTNGYHHPVQTETESPPVYLDYQSLHLSVEQERQAAAAAVVASPVASIASQSQASVAASQHQNQGSNDVQEPQSTQQYVQIQNLNDILEQQRQNEAAVAEQQVRLQQPIEYGL
uniref:Integrase_H2C2 domain-containing protein n=1 Tax=Panagrellus redivivus TaxID=6233 RepID=A0A7E4VEB1_PANRE